MKSFQETRRNQTVVPASPAVSLSGGVAVDDGNLDPARAADQRDQGAGGAFGVGAKNSFDPLAGNLERPRAAGDIRKMIGIDIGDQVAEGVAEDDLTHEPPVGGGWRLRNYAV